MTVRPATAAESQTQDETQAPQRDEDTLKRTSAGDDHDRPLKKKMKISLAVGIDLAE